MSSWKLVEVVPSPVPLPGVQEARQQWAGKWVWYRVGRPGSYTWRRGKVQRITNDGDVILSEVRDKQLVPVKMFYMQHIPLLLRAGNRDRK